MKESINAIFLQTYDDFELIVVDDASKDDSLAVINELARGDGRLRVITHEKNCGASRSRNDGIKAARGEYVAFCDADDIWKPNKLESQIKLLSENPSYDVTYCDADIIDENGALTGKLFSDQFRLPRRASGNLFAQLSVRNFVNMQTVLLRREAVSADLFFDERIKWIEDWWQWVRISHRHKFMYDIRALAQYRVHSNSTGITQRPGIRVNRIRVCRLNLALHPDMPMLIQANLWYMMGLEMHQMRRKRLARKCFRQSIDLALKAGDVNPIAIKAVLRCVASFF